MKYTLITAALAAVSLATTVNIDVEGADLAADNNRHGHHSRLNRHHHGHHGHHNHRHNRHGRSSWWAELFGHKNRNHNHNGRHHHNVRDLDELLEELFKVNFECVRQAEWSTQQFKECYRKHAERVNEDLVRRDDEIFGDDNDYDDEDVDEESKNRRHRHHHHHHHHRHGRNYADHDQLVLESSKGRNHKHQHRSNDYKCRIQTEDPLRQDEILRQCCEVQQLGRYNPDQQTCEDIEGRGDRDEFQQCAYEQGVLEAECWRERRGGREDEE